VSLHFTSLFAIPLLYLETDRSQQHRLATPSKVLLPTNPAPPHGMHVPRTALHYRSPFLPVPQLRRRRLSIRRVLRAPGYLPDYQEGRGERDACREALD
jgi:hypothetical protein